MATYKDADGNDIETVSPEEAAALKQQVEEAAALKTQLAERDEKLKSLENKDLNFKRLRDMNAEEKAKLTADQLAAKQEADELRQRFELSEKARLDETKDEFFDRNVRGNEDLKRKVEYEFSLLNMPEGTPRELKAKYEKAYSNASGSSALNPMNAYVPSTGYDPVKPSGTDIKSLKPEVADLAKRMGLSFSKKA